VSSSGKALTSKQEVLKFNPQYCQTLSPKVVFLNTNSDLIEKRNQESNLINNSLKKKIPGINLTKKVKGLYNENYKTLKKEIIVDSIG
jgi:hypothetical protein